MTVISCDVNQVFFAIKREESINTPTANCCGLISKSMATNVAIDTSMVN